MPLREPTTLTLSTHVRRSPRKLICVLGEASAEPGIGDTATGFAFAAAIAA
jgi:hypothetical protein